MGLIIFILILGLSVALPVKCYSDGQYRIKCLEMRGTMEPAGASDQSCVVDTMKASK